MTRTVERAEGGELQEIKSPYQMIIDMFEEMGTVPPETERVWEQWADARFVSISRHYLLNPETGKYNVDAFHIQVGGVDFTIAQGGLVELRIPHLSVTVGDIAGFSTRSELVVHADNHHPMVRDMITNKTGLALVGWVHEMVSTGKFKQCPLKITFGLPDLRDVG